MNPALALRIPIDWTEVPPGVSPIVTLLRTFSLVEECGSFDPDLTLCGLFDAPIIWLAILISRTCTDLTATMSYLECTGLLGIINRARFEDVFPEYIDVDLCAVRAAITDPELPQIGFWLPQDMDNMVPFASYWYKRYSALERVYEECFGPDSWGDKSLIINSITPYLNSK